MCRPKQPLKIILVFVQRFKYSGSRQFMSEIDSIDPELLKKLATYVGREVGVEVGRRMGEIIGAHLGEVASITALDSFIIALATSHGVSALEVSAGRCPPKAMVDVSKRCPPGVEAGISGRCPPGAEADVSAGRCPPKTMVDVSKRCPPGVETDISGRCPPGAEADVSAGRCPPGETELEVPQIIRVEEVPPPTTKGLE